MKTLIYMKHGSREKLNSKYGNLRDFLDLTALTGNMKRQMQTSISISLADLKKKLSVDGPLNQTHMIEYKVY